MTQSMPVPSIATSIAPNFLVVGSAKSATSSLWAILRRHPQVFLPHNKEPTFFNDDLRYLEWGWNWYLDLFKGAEGSPARGECSNRYSMHELWPHTAKRIASDLPGVRIIYIARHPLRRIESYWMEKRSHGGEEVHHDFNTSVRRDRAWLVDSSCYWSQINHYRELIPDDRILPIFYEDFRDDSCAVVMRCLAFLGVDTALPLEDISPVVLNISKGKKQVRPSFSILRSMLFYPFLKSMVPRAWRIPISHWLMMKKVNDRPAWKPETRRWVLEQVVPDAERFLEFAGKPRDFWSWTD